MPGRESERETVEIDLPRRIDLVLTYDGAGNLTQVVYTDTVTGEVRTMTLAYDGAGNLVTVAVV